jgi:iron complex transport system permease protein
MRAVVVTGQTRRLGAVGFLLRRSGSAPPSMLSFFDDGGEEEPNVFPTRLRAFHVGLGVCFLLGAAVVSLLIGPADLSPGSVLKEVLSRLPFVPVHSGLSATGVAVVWQLRVPRIVLGGLVGSMLALAGSSYQGVFHNPLADPYLLGVASGAGLGATLAVIEIPHLVSWSVDPVPIAAFIGAVVAVSATFALGRSGNQARNATTLVLAGIAVGAFFTAVQTFLLQQQNPQVLAEVYDWILGGLSTAGWGQVELILPYLAVSTVALLACRRLLDALSVGDDEANSLGVRADRVRLVIVAAATLGTAAAVSVSGLIGFVGIIVPHTIRLIAGPSYQRILPLSVLFGAGFLILADLLARTVLSPGEIPLGVVTAFLGAPFFLIVLRQARTFS